MMVNRNENSTQKLIASVKNKFPSLFKTGIYEIGWQNGYEYKYYGKSERNVTIRYSEHDYCIKKNNFKSAVAKHTIENGHETNISKVILIQPVSGRNTHFFECYEMIHKIENKKKQIKFLNMNDGNRQREFGSFGYRMMLRSFVV